MSGKVNFLLGFGTGVVTTIGALVGISYYAIRKGFVPIPGMENDVPEDLGKNPNDFEVEVNDKK